MTNLLRGAFLTLGLMTLAAAPASAFTITFDENGNCDGCTFSEYVTDPTGGVLGNALVYGLPDIVVTGDVNIADPSGAISDMLRFADVLDANGDPVSSYMVYYSYDSMGDLADVGNINISPDAFVGTTENADGTFTYFANPNTYNGISGVSSIPEPSTWALMTLGFAALGFAAYRTKKTARAVVAA
jgi:hypothetical protein